MNLIEILLATVAVTSRWSVLIMMMGSSCRLHLLVISRCSCGLVLRLLILILMPTTIIKVSTSIVILVVLSIVIRITLMMMMARRVCRDCGVRLITTEETHIVNNCISTVLLAEQ